VIRAAPHRAAWLFLALAAGACARKAPPSEPAPPVFVPRVLARLPHDPGAFTQGLLIDGPFWLESTGQYGASDLREVDRATGQVRRRVPLAPEFFGEGLALLEGLLYQLTWREGVCIVYDRETLKELRRFRYPEEGWGLASDGRKLYLSDGSDRIRVIEPKTFAEIRRFPVRSALGPVKNLNELEWVDGELWANIWKSGWVVRIDPESGLVRGFVDLRALPPEADRHPRMDVLNGIAVDPENGDIWVTGKYWPALYKIERPPPP